MYCGDCGKECETEVLDHGIGGYEYCGQRGCDTQLALTSVCCEAAVFTEEELKHEYDHLDYDEDCRAAAAEDRAEAIWEREQGYDW